MIDDILEWICMKIFPVLFLLLFICLAFGLLYFGWRVFNPSKTFSLETDEWSCSKEYEYQSSTMILVGKIMVPQIITYHDCIQWSRR